MTANEILPLLHSPAAAALLHKSLEAVGAGTLIAGLVPKLVAWGVPAAIRAADWVARGLINSPLRPLILWKKDAIIAFLRALLAALTQIAQAFEGELEKDLAETAAQPEAKQRPQSA